jgi:micrococcal nuclease
MYEYNAELDRVVDGDTVDVNIDLGFGIWIRDERVRVMGIDTPESRTRDLDEKVFGLAPKNRLTELLSGDECILCTTKDRSGEDERGKFGRVLGDFKVQYNGESRLITEIMIEEGHAVPYHGGSKDALEEMHMANREKLISEGKVILPSSFNIGKVTES